MQRRDVKIKKYGDLQPKKASFVSEFPEKSSNVENFVAIL